MERRRRGIAPIVAVAAALSLSAAHALPVAEAPASPDSVSAAQAVQAPGTVSTTPAVQALDSASAAVSAPDTLSAAPAGIPSKPDSAAAPGDSALSPADAAPAAPGKSAANLDTLHRFDVTLGAGVFFLDFGDRRRFNDQLNAYAADAKKSAATRADSQAISTVRFQNADLSFPVRLGLRWNPLEWLSLGGGAEWIWHEQDALLLRRNGYTSFKYGMQTWALFAELSVAIPKEFLTIDGGDGLRLAVRRYWLPASYLVAEWDGRSRRLWADADPAGAGWGLLLGSEFARTGPFRASFALQWRSIEAKSGQSWRKILPDGDAKGRAKWSLGGIGAEFVLSWGAFPKVVDRAPKAAAGDEGPAPSATLPVSESERAERAGQSSAFSETAPSEEPEQAPETARENAPAASETGAAAIEAVPSPAPAEKKAAEPPGGRKPENF